MILNESWFHGTPDAREIEKDGILSNTGGNFNKYKDIIDKIKKYKITKN